jgi:hypothetical protein
MNSCLVDGRGHSLSRLLLVVILFVASRAFVLAYPAPASDISIYAPYVHEKEAARRQGVSFYEFHARSIQDQIDAARAAGQRTSSLEEYKVVEYPPLALIVMRIPGCCMDLHDAPTVPPSVFLEAYRPVFRVFMALVDLLLFLVVLLLVQALHARESAGERARRLLTYLAATLLLWHQLYDRLDLFQSLLIMFGLALLTSRWHYGWSMAVLALAVNFKVVPIVLAPVWILGSMPADDKLALSQGRVLSRLAIRTGLLLGLVMACFVPFYLRDGNNSLGFLVYHRARGLEIESLYSTCLIPFQVFGMPAEVHYGHGCLNLDVPLSPLFASLAPWLTVAGLTGATILLFRHSRCLAKPSETKVPEILPSPSQPRLFQRLMSSGQVTLAQREPTIFAGFALLFLMLFIATNKVFSPQYLLWLAPLVMLLPARNPDWRFLPRAFLVICAATTLLLFLLLVDLPAQPGAIEPRLQTFNSPSLRFTLVLILRNGLFILTTGALAIYLFRGMRLLARQGGG